MAAKKPGKKTRKKRGELQWVCNYPGRAFDLTTLVDMLENAPGFAEFFFPVVKGAMANDPGSIECLESYLVPTDQELMDLGIPSSEVGGARKCTDAGLIVAVVAQKYA